MKTKIAALLIAAALAGCANIAKVEGDQVVNQRLAVRLADAWNKVSPPGGAEPYETWTQEGLSLDQLRFWAGIKPGQALMKPRPAAVADGKPPRVPTYASGMQADQLVDLFQTVYSADGSIVTVTKVEPAAFAGARGVRFEFTVTRKRDDLELGGVGWASVSKGDLFAATFVAPRLSFYRRLLPRAESVVRTAQVRS